MPANDALYHGPNPPGPGWEQAGTGPRGGKLWRRKGAGGAGEGSGASRGSTSRSSAPKDGQVVRAVPSGYSLSGEGPFESKEDAADFGHAEVGMPWVIVPQDGEYHIAIRDEDDDEEDAAPPQRSASFNNLLSAVQPDSSSFDPIIAAGQDEVDQGWQEMNESHPGSPRYERAKSAIMVGNRKMVEAMLQQAQHELNEAGSEEETDAAKTKIMIIKNAMQDMGPRTGERLLRQLRGQV